MSIDTTYRIQSREIMDDFTLEGEMLRDALDKIAAINRFLGGNKVTLEGIETLIADIPADREITIVDIGCGNGDMLRMLANYAIKTDRHFNLVGIDANRFTVNYARHLSEVFPNIHYRCLDVFDPEFESVEYDIVLATLTLHHFTEPEILRLLDIFKRKAKIGIVINDLERSWLAYRLFQGLSLVCGLNKMSREDGLLSILRGFRKNELQRLSELAGFDKAIIRWKWAFRYQLIIPTT